MRFATLVVGLGSPHGDDQVGWLVADQLVRNHCAGAEVRRAESPIDILDWLEGRRRLILCDGSRGEQPVGRIQRFAWPCEEINATAFVGTHDFGLAAVLELAEGLSQLPDTVLLWSIEVGDCSPGCDMSDKVRQAVLCVADEIHAVLECVQPDPLIRR